MIFLIDYHCKEGELEISSFRDDQRHLAEKKRLELEIHNLRNHIVNEVVLLEAPTEDNLRRTHRRYFEDLDQLMSSAANMNVAT